MQLLSGFLPFKGVLTHVAGFGIIVDVSGNSIGLVNFENMSRKGPVVFISAIQ